MNQKMNKTLGSALLITLLALTGCGKNPGVGGTAGDAEVATQKANELIAQELNLAEQFTVPQVGIKVWGVRPAYASAPFAQGVSNDTKSFVSSLTEPFCGMNTGLDTVNCLPDPKSVASLAMLPLRPGPLGSTAQAFGLLVLASPDAHRFNSAMGTDFLARLAELASAALSPLR